MSTNAESQAAERPLDVPLKRIFWSSIKLNLAIGFFLLAQWVLLGLGGGVIAMVEILGLSLLMSWRFVATEASSRFFWHGTMLGVMANIWRLGIWFFIPGIEIGEFILFGALILIGCIAGGFLASRR